MQHQELSPTCAAWTDGLVPPERLLDADSARELRRLVAGFRRLEPELTPLDCVMLAALRASVHLERGTLPRSRPADQLLLSACLNVALHCVIAADTDLACRAGLLPALWLPDRARQTEFDRKILHWHAEYLAIVDRVAYGKELLPTPRAALLHAFEVEQTELRLVEANRLVQTMQTAARSAAARRGEPLRAEELTTASCSAEFRLAAAEAGSVVELAVVDADGRLGLGVHQVRDNLSLKRAVRTESLDAPMEKDGEEPRWAGIEGANTRAEREEAEARLETSELVALIERFVEARRGALRGGSTRRVVVERLVELLTGELSLTDLSHAHGFSVSAFSRAFDQECQALRRWLVARRRVH